MQGLRRVVELRQSAVPTDSHKILDTLLLQKGKDLGSGETTVEADTNPRSRKVPANTIEYLAEHPESPDRSGLP